MVVGLEIASRLRVETTMSLQWMSDGLEMGGTLVRSRTGCAMRNDNEITLNPLKIYHYSALTPLGANFTFEDFLSLKRFLSFSEREAPRD